LAERPATLPDRAVLDAFFALGNWEDEWLVIRECLPWGL
jgi:hypothetical protein